jgi:UDP-GlcNAc:undecaprenyl-phosphate/decaprenyl-phosphate GlcNAc-1-phosphate transferase
VASAVLVGMCVGFLPHNFNPARIFMGDTGAMLIGLLLAYGPISSTQTLDPSVLVNYNGTLGHPLNRFPTILPLLLPVVILVIPYADLLLAVIRRTAAGKSPFAADRQHLHHRLLGMGHSHRQSVLLMYLWAALFSGSIVGLSVVRTQLIWLAAITVAALAALLLATVPQLRPWRARESSQAQKADGAQRYPAAPGQPAPAPAASPAPVMGAPVEPSAPGWGAGNGWGRFGQESPVSDGNGAAPDGHASLPSYEDFSAPPRSRRR